MWRLLWRLFRPVACFRRLPFAYRGTLAREGGRRNYGSVLLRARLVRWLQLQLRGIWLHWDRYPQDGTLSRPFCGLTEVRGWAVSPTGVHSVEVYCDDQLLGTAAIGLRRRDLFYQFPHIRSSRRGGFQFIFDTTRVPNGHHALTIVARNRRGRTARQTFATYIHNLAMPTVRRQRQTTCVTNEPPVVFVRAPFPLIELEKIRSILIVKLDHLGDVLLTIPAMRRLRELFPEARITALVGNWTRPLIEAEPCIDEVLTYDFFFASSARGSRPLTDDMAREVEDLLAGRRFDLAIDLRREADTRPFLHWSRALYTVGYANRGEHDWLTLAIPWDDVCPVLPPRRHVTLDALRLVEMIPLSSQSDIVTSYRLAGTDDLRAKQLLSERIPATHGLLVGLHPGAGRAIKCWPAERFARLADRMCAELDATVVLFGTEADQREVEGVRRHMRRRERLVSLACELSLPQFMALLPELDFFIGNDSGPTHLAAAAGIPTLGVYAGTIDASQWAPLGPQAAVIQRRTPCSPCYLAKKPDCPYGVTCLQELSVEQVWEAAMRVLLQKWGKIPVRHRPAASRALLNDHGGSCA